MKVLKIWRGDGGQQRPDVPQVPPAKGQAVRQAVSGRGLLRQLDGLRQQLHAGDGQLPLALEQQKAQQAGAAAQVADPEPRPQPGEAAQQEGVGAGAEQGVVVDEGQPARAEGFPVVQVDPSMDDVHTIIMEKWCSCNGLPGMP